MLHEGCSIAAETSATHMHRGIFLVGVLVSVYITSAMHNIIASERSGVECARGEIYVHCEITITRI